MPEEPGASPQVEHGHLRIANELWDALNRSNLSGTERRCVDLVIRLSYGCGKKYAVLDHWRDFECVGVKSGNVRKVLGGLARKRVLAYKVLRLKTKAVPAGSPQKAKKNYRIKCLVVVLNKDYLKWRDNKNEALLVGDEATYSRLISRNLRLPKKTNTFIMQCYPQITSEIKTALASLSTDKEISCYLIGRLGQPYPQISLTGGEAAHGDSPDDPKPSLKAIRIKPVASDGVTHHEKEQTWNGMSNFLPKPKGGDG